MGWTVTRHSSVMGGSSSLRSARIRIVTLPFVNQVQ
jgi:hypothetical protein